MKPRDIVIAVIIIAVVGFILYNISNTDNTPELEADPTPTVTESDLEDRFQRDIPDDAEKAELMQPEGSEEEARGVAIATRTFENGQYMASVLADIDQPRGGTSYYAWISEGENYVLLGRMQSAKGGWLIDYESATDYSGHNRVVISEQASAGAMPENIILEGNF